MKESILAKTLIEICEISPPIKRFLARNWYQLVSRLDKEALMPFMNFGYAPLNDEKEVELHERDELHRHFIQMYRHVIGKVDLYNQCVLEVGCGRGGSAAYVKRSFEPRLLIGIDVAPNAIRFCRDYHRISGLSFLQGDAEALPFGDSSFDAVINIESSHGYGHVDRFLCEVFRVLRTGGYFLFADYRKRCYIDVLRTQICEAGFTILNESLINAQVVRALDLDSPYRTEMIRRKVPRILQTMLYDFAGTEGTRMYNAFKNGTVEYRSWTLQKV
ncbi:MAG: class I SAM-dependent methyltransferase [Ktedonobacteraceae bacterium]